MRTRLTGLLLVGVALAIAVPALAQPPRQNVIWARSIGPSATITLDGVLGEPQWAQAESVLVRYGTNNGDPGSGYKEEGGRLAKDSTYAWIKFLRQGNQLYMAAVCRDSSVGGSADFNRFDGFLMAIKDHRDPFATQHGPIEYLYSWWHPEDPALNVPGSPPGFRGEFGEIDTTPRSPAKIAAWDAFTKVRGGISHSDADVDSGYTVEMRFDMSVVGYDFTDADGDIGEFNISIYDTDWYWPLVGARFSANRGWWQGPWGNAMWYDEVRIHGRDDVTVTSGAVPAVGGEYTVKNLGAVAPPVIDGNVDDAVWANAPSFDIRYGDFTLRDTYPSVMRWRAGQYQPDVNGGQAFILDPGDATVRMFFKDDTVYFAFDVRDGVVQHYPLEDRWDGIRVSITDRSVRGVDRNLAGRALSFIVGPTGQEMPMEYLPFLRDTAQGARIELQLKPGTTVDTAGTNVDTGWTAELAVDLTKLNYPTGRGDGILWFGITLFDGDSFTNFTDSYGSRAWWGRERENLCCAASAYMDPTQFVVGVERPDGGTGARLAGNFPNPFGTLTVLRFSLPGASTVSLDVFDLQGRKVASRPLGTLAAGAQQATFARGDLGAGLYLYRLSLADPATGAARGALSGKMMVLK
jgi:hypothetical protein